MQDGADNAGATETEITGLTEAEYADMQWNAKLKTQPMIVQACFKYIGDKHCTMWRDWEVGNRERRLLAAKELANDIHKVDKILRSKWNPL